jgi:spore coat-associated protein N
MIRVKARVLSIAGSARALLMVVATLTLLGAAVRTVAFSGAGFVFKTSNPGNGGAAGSVTFTNSKEGVAILSVANIYPGQAAQSGTVVLTGGGTFTGTYTLSKVSLTDSPSTPPLSAALNLSITNTSTGGSFYNGALGSFSSAALGTIAPGATLSLTFAITFPTGGATATLQGATTTMTLRFVAVP